MAKFNSETLLRGDCLLPQKCNTELENLALPNHLQLSLFVPLPLPTPGSAPGFLVEHTLDQNGAVVGWDTIY